ncbi:MAG TPA: hypothetical protein VFF26_06885 [Gallionella sp.]|nr:hypothetical protein [Gallionella sp.]
MDAEQTEGMLGALHLVTASLLLELSARDPAIFAGIQADLTEQIAELQRGADPGTKTFRLATFMQAEIDGLFRLGNTPGRWMRGG